jgi:hypothetical protein
MARCTMAAEIVNPLAGNPGPRWLPSRPLHFDEHNTDRVRLDALFLIHAAEWAKTK